MRTPILISLLTAAFCACGNDEEISPDAPDGNHPPPRMRIGDLDGTTDAAGLFVAEGVTGPQTVSVKASTYRSDVWIGAPGLDVTSFSLDADEDKLVQVGGQILSIN